ncbi:hypothetical protein PHYSODRAFT_347939 [Phytophthora sojae]|uniref:Glutamate synthase alpha subunit C-terminal domain-containing protein n=1 Tax=Phytophthora sojae (strain P6497) TaxID=1094619 RepID=G5A632_PHYSP|nr:hypothetical protein PHYSODRAFT_347939 [Phytophthora sojae]EGZ08787.1 hypothetical protein PHYSODRAFT_347939 [Phytophthora sojae]|eukprot:XP_009535420.1 hypothetical protein PHYSODRAFT_347939 [Phytophthora sojae]
MRDTLFTRQLTPSHGVVSPIRYTKRHLPEYVPRVVVLGPTGRNFAAGMSGGIAYIFDADSSFQKKCNMGMVGVAPLTETASAAEIQEVKALITKHLERTQSPKAQKLLGNWDASVTKFMRVMPYDYERVLLERATVVKETKKSASASA